MDKLARLLRLRQVVAEAGGKIVGRKKLHKLAYLCQRAGTDLGQSFTFHMYGVYSPSLAQDLAAAEAWDVLTEDKSPGDGSYTIALGKESFEGEVEFSRDAEAGFAIVRQLKDEPAVTLEVMSTIVYLWDAGYRDERLQEKLTELKGHLSGFFPRAAGLAEKHFEIPAVV